jgi:hypothetical protein
MNRRKTPLPTANPLALTEEFSNDAFKVAQWNAFLRKGKLSIKDLTLSQVIATLQDFLMPPVIAIVRGETFEKKWLGSQTWQGE